MQQAVSVSLNCMTARSTLVLHPPAPLILHDPLILTNLLAPLGHPTGLDQLGTQTLVSLLCQRGPLAYHIDHYPKLLGHICPYHFRHG